MFVCVSVCPELTPKPLDRLRWDFHKNVAHSPELVCTAFAKKIGRQLVVCGPTTIFPLVCIERRHLWSKAKVYLEDLYLFLLLKCASFDNNISNTKEMNVQLHAKLEASRIQAIQGTNQINIVNRSIMMF